jgi:PilZ domain
MFDAPHSPRDNPTAPEPGRVRRIRVDTGRATGRDLAPGRGSFLGAFHVGEKADPVLERRTEPRHHHVECLAWIGWRIWRGFRMNDAVLVDLSRGGARVFLDSTPPRGRDLWLFLETPGQKAVVKARVLAVESTAAGQCIMRVEFRDPCPYALFEAAVCGLHSTDPKTRPAHATKVGRPVITASGPTC